MDIPTEPCSCLQLVGPVIRLMRMKQAREITRVLACEALIKLAELPEHCKVLCPADERKHPLLAVFRLQCSKRFCGIPVLLHPCLADNSWCCLAMQRHTAYNFTDQFPWYGRKITAPWTRTWSLEWCTLHLPFAETLQMIAWLGPFGHGRAGREANAPIICSNRQLHVCQFLAVVAGHDIVHASRNCTASGTETPRVCCHVLIQTGQETLLNVVSSDRNCVSIR